ncbi:hypothetical protein H5V45_12490 [Nocardioides sp. KIGAM211]|uniref:PQQ-like domain-containing protein n=1 Tax=Nocardioides luti TaxID=2761101 RepID=A0A7X0VAU4_9ACTN|nr:hypothetical protein [Nocardioides luti]MBB6628139.1 hypothetical protein [Nocardioides luti]
MSPSLRRVLSAGAATGLVLTLGAGCSWIKDPAAQRQGDPDAATEPSSTATADPTAMPTLFLSDATASFPEEDVIDAAVGTDVVLTMTAGRVVARSLPDLDTAYSLTSDDGSFTDLWVDDQARTGYTLEVRTEPGEGTEVGTQRYVVQRFDLETGEISEAAIGDVDQDPRAPAEDVTGEIAAVQDDTVVIDSSVPNSRAAHTAVAMDLRTEDVAWSARPAQVLTATSDAVVVDTGTPDEAGRIRALTLARGLTRWSALPGTLGARAIGTTDDSVLVVRTDEVFTQPTITSLDLATGAAGKPRTTDAWDWDCSPAYDIAVCTIGEPDQPGAQVVGWDVARNREAWELPTDGRFAPIVSVVTRGLVYGLLDSGQGVVLDAATGRDVAGDTGAGPVGVNYYGGVVVYSGRAVFLYAGEGDPDASAAPSASASPSSSPSASESALPSEDATTEDPGGTIDQPSGPVTPTISSP